MKDEVKNFYQVLSKIFTGKSFKFSKHYYKMLFIVY